MALDYAFLKVLCRELDTKLRLARIEKIYMPTGDEAVFYLRTLTGSERLFISARSGGSRLHLTAEDFDNPAVPVNFCMILRKYVGRGRIESITPVPGERVVLIEFTSVAETGELMKLTLSVEMMGRYSNLVLVRDGTVIDALKRISFDKSEVRQLLPQIPFTLPPPQGKLNIDSDSPEAIARAALGFGGELDGAILKAVAGISPVVCREIAFETAAEAADAALLSQAEEERLVKAIAHVQAAMNGSETCVEAVYDNGRAVDFSFIELKQYGECTHTRFDSPSELLCSYFEERDRAERQKNRSRDLIKQTTRLYERAKRKKEARLRDKQDSALADQKRLYGELLTANLHAVEKGAPTVSVLNYYTGETVIIPLDRRLSASANAQKYYKEYRKLVTARDMLETLLKQDEEELQYLSSVLYASLIAQTEAEFDAIRGELKSAGYLKNFKEKDFRRKIKKQLPLEYAVSGGLRVISGRNNLQNEAVTFKTAEKHDLWFHAKNIPGSHTVLLCGGKTPDEESVREAAMIAAANSSAPDGPDAAVDYTEVKNVKKQAGSKPGMVNYSAFKTLFAAPDRPAAEKMLVKKTR